MNPFGTAQLLLRTSSALIEHATLSCAILASKTKTARMAAFLLSLEDDDNSSDDGGGDAFLSFASCSVSPSDGVFMQARLKAHQVAPQESLGARQRFHVLPFSF